VGAGIYLILILEPADAFPFEVGGIFVVSGIL
jgi:hypothetical protein